MITRRHARLAAQASAEPPIPAWLLMAAAVFQLALNVVLPTASILFGSILVSLIVWLARVEYLPALIVTQLARTDFALGGHGTTEFAFAQFEASALVIAGFPVSVNYFLGFAGCGRVLTEWILRPDTFKAAGVAWLLPLWVVAMVPASIMSVLGRLEMAPSWTGPIRMVFMSGSLFYGVILARTGWGTGRLILRWLVPMAAVFFALGMFGAFRHRILFVLPCFAAPALWLALKEGDRPARVLAIVSFLLAIGYCLGIGPGGSSQDDGYAAGLLGTGSSTFTLNALLLASIVITAVVLLPAGIARAVVARLLGLPAFLTVIGFSLLIGYLSPRYSDYSQRGFASDQKGMTVGERLRSKVFDDRSRIWHAALSEITQPPYLLQPSGRPLLIEHPSVGVVVWRVGAHNTFFEVVRQQRWLNGTILLVMVLAMMMGCARVLDSAAPAAAKALAVGTLVTATVGMATGHYPLSDQAAFWFLAFGGLAMACSREAAPFATGPARPGRAVRRLRWRRGRRLPVTAPAAALL